MHAVAAIDGNRLALKTLVAFGPRPMPNGSFSVFSRSASGWQIESVPGPSVGSAFDQEPLFNPEMTVMGVNSYTTTPISPRQLFQIGPPGGPYSTIAETPTNYERPGAEVDFLAGATADFTHVFLDSTDHTLLPGPATGTDEHAHDVYEWAGGALRHLVNVQGDGSLVSACGAQFEFASKDGSNVAFASPDPKASGSGEAGCEQPTQLYERVNGSTTVDVSKPNTGVVNPTGFHPVTFQGASADGSKVFFTTETDLTHDAEGIHDHGTGGRDELYEYDANAKEGEKLTRLSRGTTGTAEGKVEREFVLVSEDAAEVYFYAHGHLTPDAQNLTNATEYENLYRYDTGSGEIHYIATVREPSFLPSVTSGRLQSSASSNNVTPDGRFFVFLSRAILSLSSGVVGNPVNDPGGYDEVYRYDKEAATLTCVSCRPNNTPAQGGASLVHEPLFSWDETPPAISMSEDGSYVFFQSNDELVPQDVNGTGGDPTAKLSDGDWTDVYEWHDGVVSLISSGTSSQEAVFLGASGSGSDVFFMTHSQLVAGDTDSSNDIYDARINGGFAVPRESVACLGDTCQAAAPAVNDPTPAWSSFSGPGNQVPAVSSPVVVRPLTKVQLLARALKACRVKHNRGKRRSCEALARKKYGPAPGRSARRGLPRVDPPAATVGVRGERSFGCPCAAGGAGGFLLCCCWGVGAGGGGGVCAEPGVDGERGRGADELPAGRSIGEGSLQHRGHEHG